MEVEISRTGKGFYTCTIEDNWFSYLFLSLEVNCIYTLY
jgi:hypothetical protein